jgi:type V secretory pathway adhesin AidA
MHATLAGAQARVRPVGAVPPSRAVSTLTAADSAALVEAAARRVLDAADAPTRCVRSVRDSVQGAAGAAFLKAAGLALSDRPSANDNASDDDIALLSLRDGDTATVILRRSGTATVPRAVFSLNVIDYYFVRDTVAGGWRYVDQRLAEAADYVVDKPSSSRVPCRYRTIRR